MIKKKIDISVATVLISLIVAIAIVAHIEFEMSVNGTFAPTPPHILEFIIAFFAICMAMYWIILSPNSLVKKMVHPQETKGNHHG